MTPTEIARAARTVAEDAEMDYALAHDRTDSAIAYAISQTFRRFAERIEEIQP